MLLNLLDFKHNEPLHLFLLNISDMSEICYSNYSLPNRLIINLRHNVTRWLRAIILFIVALYQWQVNDFLLIVQQNKL